MSWTTDVPNKYSILTGIYFHEHVVFFIKEYTNEKTYVYSTIPKTTAIQLKNDAITELTSYTNFSVEYNFPDSRLKKINNAIILQYYDQSSSSARQYVYYFEFGPYVMLPTYGNDYIDTYYIKVK